MGVRRRLTKAAENYFFEDHLLCQERTNRGNGDPGRPVRWKPVDPGADGRKGDGAYALLLRQRQRGVVTTGEQVFLALAAALPDRPNGMDDIAGGKQISLRDPVLIPS